MDDDDEALAREDEPLPEPRAAAVAASSSASEGYGQPSAGAARRGEVEEQGRTVKDVAAVLVDARVLCADLGEGAEDGGVDLGRDELCVVVVGRVVGLVVLVVVAELVVLAVLVLDCFAAGWRGG